MSPLIAMLAQMAPPRSPYSDAALGSPLRGARE
jgi:hypothetical protein